MGDAAEDDVEKAELLFEAVDDVPSLCLTPPEALAPPGQVPAVTEELSMFTPGLMSRELLLLHKLDPAVSWCMKATPIAAACATAAAAFW